MAKKVSKAAKKEKKIQNQQYLGYNWISMRTGLIVVTVISVGLTILIAKTTVPAIGWGEGLLWAIGFGVGIWVVFIGYYLFNRLVRNKRN
jgi:formate/nitrite transporter FocA (FNT family)